MSGPPAATEPNPEGKVLIATSRGDIEIELWTREAPKACRNFIQLCLEGYYVDTTCHRVVSGFIVQFGDPSGTGNGGQSIWNEPFEDEFHARLKYTRRGLLGMANGGGVNDNGSQFFITLDATPELQGKNTLFGRVVGNTIFNVLRIGESECDGERPLYPTTITRTDVIVNPFTDIVPRTTLEELQRRKQELQKQATKRRRPLRTNKVALSFGGDDDDEDDDGAPDFVKKKATPLVDAAVRPQAKIVSDTKPVTVAKPSHTATQKHVPASADLQVEPTRNAAPTVPKEDVPTASLQDQIAALKKQLRGTYQPEEDDSPQPVAQEVTQPAAPSKTGGLASLREQYKKGTASSRKRARAAADEEETLAKLSQFRSKIANDSGNGTQESDSRPAARTDSECLLHGVPGCMSCFDRMGEKNDDDDGGNTWLGHKLEFEQDRLGKDLSHKKAQEDELIIIDPRTKAGQMALEDRDARRSRKGKEGHHRRDGPR